MNNKRKFRKTGLIEDPIKRVKKKKQLREWEKITANHIRDIL